MSNRAPAHQWVVERDERLRDFFGLDGRSELISPDVVEAFFVPETIAEHLRRFNLEWHIIPTERAVSIEDDSYRARLYPTFRFDPQQQDYKRTNRYKAVTNGHRKHQGRIVGIETTIKPCYLPGGRQFYGTQYGFDDRADPFAPYLSRSSFMSKSSTRQIAGTRYGHNYSSLRQLITLINEDWRAQDLMPPGFRLTICPPVIFNLIGTVFHREWSETESLELGFYRDDHDNATCYAVGANAPGDFSYIREIESESDWTLLGFRATLVPE